MPIFQLIFRTLLWLFLAGLGLAATLTCATLLYLSPKLPAVQQILEIQLQTPLRIYSSEGQLIAEFGEKKRAPIQYANVPQDFIHAVLAAEDARFFSHPGVDFKGLTRAVLELVTTGSIQTGGSTITMQVAKNYFLTMERTFLRKFNEILLALDMERKLSKEQILELYLNKIYLGHRAYGIQAAAQVYYGQPIAELNIAQLAMLAGLPKAPSSFNPVTNPERALIRRNWILQRMQELGYIDAATMQSALAAPVTASLHDAPVDIEAPYVAEMVRRRIIAEFGTRAYTEGYRVYTTIRSDLQSAAVHAAQKGLIEYDQRHGYRGPESQLELVEAGSDETDQTVILDALRSMREVGPLQPAVVISVGTDAENPTRALLADGQAIEIGFESMKWARAYIDNINRGPEPTAPAEVVARGDVIRVYQSDSEWLFAQLPIAQTALVSMDPRNGAVLALIGGFDFKSSKFNRATQGGRQAGSSFKPFIYSAALDWGMTPATIINDAPVVFADDRLESTWRPENSSGRFHGPTRLRKALYLSRNLVSIRVLRQIGFNHTISYASDFGFDPDRMPKDLSLALGSAAFTPWEITRAYGVLANGGFEVEPWYIERVENDQGDVLLQTQPMTICTEHCPDDAEAEAAMAAVAAETPAEPLAEPQIEPFAEARAKPSASTTTAISASTNEPDTTATPAPRYAKRVQDERINFLINDMLRDVVQRGTGIRAKALERNDLAGKTGTTNDQKDAWFTGYNDAVVTSVWVGFDQPRNLGRGEYGGKAALPIWIEYMQTALAGVPEHERMVPDGIVTVRINPETGKRVQAGSSGIFEYFREENAPEAEFTPNASPTEAAPETSYPTQLF